MTFFTPEQIYLASFLGSPLAAARLMVHNYRALQRPDQVQRIIWLGFGATVAVMAVALVLPSSLPIFVWPFVYSIASYLYARRVVGEDVARALGTVGQRGTWWRVIVISFGFFFVLFGVMLALAVVFPGLFSGDTQPTL